MSSSRDDELRDPPGVGLRRSNSSRSRRLRRIHAGDAPSHKFVTRGNEYELAEFVAVEFVVLHQPIERAARKSCFGGGGADVPLMTFQQIGQILFLELR